MAAVVEFKHPMQIPAVHQDGSAHLRLRVNRTSVVTVYVTSF